MTAKQVLENANITLDELGRPKLRVNPYRPEYFVLRIGDRTILVDPFNFELVKIFVPIKNNDQPEFWEIIYNHGSTRNQMVISEASGLHYPEVLKDLKKIMGYVKGLKNER